MNTIDAKTATDARAAREAAHGKVLAENGQHNWCRGTWVAQARIARRARMMVEATGMGPGRRVLELGYGTGDYTKLFAVTRADITGIDISPDLKRIAEQRLGGLSNVHLTLGNAETLEGVPDGHFDIVVGNGILHHLDAQRALGNLFRVLKPGGRLAFVEPNMLNPQVMMIKHIGWLKERYGESPDETAFFRWQMMRYLREARFVDLSVQPFDFAHPILSERAARRFDPFFLWLERTPILREIGGSLFITAKKP